MCGLGKRGLPILQMSCSIPGRLTASPHSPSLHGQKQIKEGTAPQKDSDWDKETQAGSLTPLALRH